jgi:hypothetical protein
MSLMQADIRHIAQKRKVDLIFFCKAEGFRPAWMRELSKEFPTYYWFMDPPLTAKLMGAEDLAMSCTYRSATCEVLANKWKGAHIIEGFDPKVWRRIHCTQLPAFRGGVCFVGSIDSHRQRVLGAIEVPDCQLTVYSGLDYENVNLVYNVHRVALNIVRDPSIISDRLVQILAAGAIPLTQWSENLLRFGWPKPEECLGFWSNFSFITNEEMNAKLKMMLSSKNQKTYQKLLDTFPIMSYTWESQMRKALSSIGY